MNHLKNPRLLICGYTDGQTDREVDIYRCVFATYRWDCAKRKHMRILGMNRKVPRHTRTHIGRLQSHLPETLSIRNVSLKKISVIKWPNHCMLIFLCRNVQTLCPWRSSEPAWPKNGPYMWRKVQLCIFTVRDVTLMTRLVLSYECSLHRNREEENRVWSCYNWFCQLSVTGYASTSKDFRYQKQHTYLIIVLRTELQIRETNVRNSLEG